MDKGHDTLALDRVGRVLVGAALGLVAACSSGTDAGARKGDAGHLASDAEAGDTSTTDVADSGTADAADTGAADASDADASQNVCAAFDDEVSAGPITVHLVNSLAEPILVDQGVQCGNAPPPFSIISTATHQSLQTAQVHAGPTCEILQKSAPYTDDCAQAFPTICIEPGGHYDYAWDGMVTRSVQMPGECFLVPSPDPQSCDRLVNVAAGGYQVKATAAPASTCSCALSDAGSCDDWFSNYDAAAPSATASVQTTLPSANVTLEFK